MEARPSGLKRRGVFARRLAEAGPEPESGDTAARPRTAETSAEPEAGASAVESGPPPVRPRDLPTSRLRLVLERRGDGDRAEIETSGARGPQLGILCLAAGRRGVLTAEENIYARMKPSDETRKDHDDHPALTP